MPRRENAGAAKRGSNDEFYERLASMELGELQKKAEALGIEHPSQMHKEDLIAAIEQRSEQARQSQESSANRPKS